MASLFGLLGLGGATFISTLGQYRHAFFVLTFAALGISFYLNYIKSQGTFASRIIFWISLAGVMAALGYAYLPA